MALAVEAALGKGYVPGMERPHRLKVGPRVAPQWWGAGAGNVLDASHRVATPAGMVTVSRPTQSVSYAATTLTSSSAN